MYYKFEEWLMKNKWGILTVVILVIYFTLFASVSAQFICNENMCRIEHYNSTRKNIIKTTQVNLDTIQYFELRETRHLRGTRRLRRRYGRYRYEYQVYAVTLNGDTYNFFGNGTYNKSYAENTVDYLNKELAKENNHNIKITFP